MLTEAEIQRNLDAVDDAVAQQALEGLTVPAETVEDMRKIARGEMSSDDLIRKLYNRFPNVPIFQPR
ncbi:MAG: antitoxin VbhA family protein [Nitrospira sp.]|jgi:hypothetical protein|nr:antitoxin VbhA family protein [Nitrospira sp.]MDR4466036.1 antitoxin VbhA family protein [Nitrospira sp.]